MSDKYEYWGRIELLKEVRRLVKENLELKKEINLYTLRLAELSEGDDY